MAQKSNKNTLFEWVNDTTQQKCTKCGCIISGAPTLLWICPKCGVIDPNKKSRYV